MNDPGGGGTSLSEALASLSQEMEGILTKAKALYKECDLDDFVDGKVGVLWGLMTLYVKCFESANVLTRPELEDQIKKHFRSHEVQDNFENLLEIEAELDGAAGKVLVITFGVREGALHWLEDTKCTHPMLLDADRQIYKSMGLEKSLHKTWGIGALTYYAERVREGRELPSPYQVKDDVNQMGGNLILDKSGKVIYLHCSKTSKDRPDIDTILDLLKNEPVSS